MSPPILMAGSRSQCKLVGMIYSVVPRELEGQLLGQLTTHYADQPDVTVIVDRRAAARRRRGPAPSDVQAQRELRDRRRRRAGGDFAVLHGEGPLTSAA
jgi:hypothetical protein